MKPEKFNSEMTKTLRELRRFVERGFPVRAGEIAIDTFKENFRLGGFVDETLKPWQPAKRLSGQTGRAADSQYGTLLSGRNHLYESFETQESTASVSVINTAHYASVHNNGERAGRGAGFKMPKRQFMGESRELLDGIDEMVEQELKKILKIQ